jgi:Na+/H+ antiporter NhaD/arsenite permease-like protein
MINFDFVLTVAVTASISSFFNTVTTIILYKYILKHLGVAQK